MKRRYLFRNIKISHQLFVMLVSSLMVILIIQVVYWTKFSSAIKNSYQTLTNNLLIQLEENLSIQADSIIQVADTISYNEYVQEFMGSQNYVMRADYIKLIHNMMKYSIITNPSIFDIILLDDIKQYVTYSSTPNWEAIDYVFSTLITDDLTANNEGSFYLINVTEDPAFIYLFAFSSFRSPNNMEYCCIFFKNDSLQRIISNVELPVESSLFLLDQNHRILGSKDVDKLGQYADDELLNLLNSNQEQGLPYYKGEKSLITQDTIPQMGCTLISIIPISRLEQPLAPLKTWGIYFGIFTFLLMSTISLIIISNIARPLNQFSIFLNDVNYQTLKKRIPTTGNNEIDQILQKFNSMLEQIQELTRKIFTTQDQFFEMELSKKNAEFSALQNQINPHFLYNTLDCIRSIAYYYEAKEIVDISSAMSKILRYSIKGPEIVTIKDELACVNNYIQIIQIRHDNRFIIEQNINAEFYSLSTVKFILQPVIENAIFHGLEPKLGSGLLRISGDFDSETDYHFEVYDSGVGISAEKVAKLNENLRNSSEQESENTSGHTGIGLVNINHRIKVKCGKSYGLYLESEEGEWTKVIIRMKIL